MQKINSVSNSDCVPLSDLSQGHRLKPFFFSNHASFNQDVKPILNIINNLKRISQSRVSPFKIWILHLLKNIFASKETISSLHQNQFFSQIPILYWGRKKFIFYDWRNFMILNPELMINSVIGWRGHQIINRLHVLYMFFFLLMWKKILFWDQSQHVSLKNMMMELKRQLFIYSVTLYLGQPVY